MTVQSYEQAWSYVAALTGGDPATTPIDLRCIHDTNKAVAAHNYFDTLPNLWSIILNYQSEGYGIFVNLNCFDGSGKHKYSNLTSIRAHAVDLDNLSALQNYERAAVWQPAPAFAVQSSPAKYHVYWTVNPYVGNDYAVLTQRKLRQLFDGDKVIIDPTRVLRMPGTLHLKNPQAPHLVHCWSLPGIGARIPVEQLGEALGGVNVIESGGGRHELGDTALAAPGMDWLRYALDVTDPNDLSRGEWIAFMAAFKQAGWTIADEPTLRAMWDEWCTRYASNDLGENEKNWSSIRDTELGWESIVNRTPALRAQRSFGAVPAAQAPGEPTNDGTIVPPLPTPAAPSLDCSGEILTEIEQAVWFSGYTYVVSLGVMMSTNGRFLNQSQFNVERGGKAFIWNGQGKTTDEAWKAATRSTLWRVPIVDHIRFIPTVAYREIVTDDLGRDGINTYRPHNLRSMKGDVGPYLRHISAMLPEPADQKILHDYLAHNIKYPGFKIPWAPVIQSAEGAGKGVLKLLMRHCMGTSYTHFPNARELADSSAKFNGWMRGKTFILADEIKVDDRMDMIEVLKPMISEETIEVQGKGADQVLEDNFSNWLFFTNWRNAIPVNKNGRRFAILFSALQTAEDMLLRQMGESYFKALYDWLKADGCAIIADYYLNYDIERGAVPMRAPNTSSMAEAIRVSRSPLERIIAEQIEDQVQGFRGGWISSLVVARIAKEQNMRISQQTIETVLVGMGYSDRGRANRPWFPESPNTRATLFSLPTVTAGVETYGAAQGYDG